MLFFLRTGDHLALVDYFKAGQCANLSVPTNENYLPMLYLLGIQQKTNSSSLYTIVLIWEV